MGRRAPRLQIACVGRLRPPYDAVGRLYQERIDRMAGLRVDEVAAEPVQHGEQRARAAEADRLRARLLPRALRVALDPAARPPASSEAFAAWLRRRMDDRPVAFLVGGAAGLDPALLAEADERASLGPLTMPHQLARVVLTEQLYRALCISSGHPYPH
ncbi:MAG: 23S rRNA (pseudouridine(1915)-N(3))-methyltransferase RlmH [Thermoleophilia bacterium]